MPPPGAVTPGPDRPITGVGAFGCPAEGTLKIFDLIKASGIFVITGLGIYLLIMFPVWIGKGRDSGVKGPAFSGPARPRRPLLQRVTLERGPDGMRLRFRFAEEARCAPGLLDGLLSGSRALRQSVILSAEPLAEGDSFPAVSVPVGMVDLTSSGGVTIPVSLKSPVAHVGIFLCSDTKKAGNCYLHRTAGGGKGGPAYIYHFAYLLVDHTSGYLVNGEATPTQYAELSRALGQIPDLGVDLRTVFGKVTVLNEAVQYPLSSVSGDELMLELSRFDPASCDAEERAVAPDSAPGFGSSGGAFRQRAWGEYRP